MYHFAKLSLKKSGADIKSEREGATQRQTRPPHKVLLLMLGLKFL
jgi:hypothetical protein